MAGMDWLVALSGMLKGAEGFPKGMEESQQADLKRQQLEETARRNQALEGLANPFVDVPGVGQVHKAVLPYVKAEQAADREAKQTQALGEAFSGMAVPSPGRAETETGDPQLTALSKLLPHLGLPGARQVIVEHMKEQVPQFQSNVTQGEEGPGYVTFNKRSGEPVKSGTLGLGAKPPQSAAQNLQRKRLEAEWEMGQFKHPPKSPQFEQELGIRMERPVPVAPGGEVVLPSMLPRPTGPGPSQPSAPTPGGAPPSPPGVMYKRPPQPTEKELETATSAKAWVDNAEGAATALEQYLQRNPGKGAISYAARTKVQAMPIVGALPLTTKEEQALASSIGNLQIDWERAKGGVRMASSPLMQERIRLIFGDPTNAATPQHLRTVAAMMRKELYERSLLESKTGRMQVSGWDRPTRFRIQNMATGEKGWATLAPGDYNLPMNVSIVGESD